MAGTTLLLTRILHQAAFSVAQTTVIFHGLVTIFEFRSGYKLRWPRPRRSFARLRVLPQP